MNSNHPTDDEQVNNIINIFHSSNNNDNKNDNNNGNNNHNKPRCLKCNKTMTYKQSMVNKLYCKY